MFKTVITAVFIVALSTVAWKSEAAQYFSKNKLHPNCLKVEPTPKLSIEWGLKLFAGARFYVPFGSSTALKHMSQLLSGNNTKMSDENLDKMCALVRIKGFTLNIEGYASHYMVQDCSVIKKGQNDCVVNTNSENPSIQKKGDGITSIVWTDNSESMAIVRCTEDGLYNDWYVFSTQTKLNETVKSSILSKMQSLGFPENDAFVAPSYNGCKLFSPEEDEDN